MDPGEGGCRFVVIRKRFEESSFVQVDILINRKIVDTSRVIAFKRCGVPPYRMRKAAPQGKGATIE
jgi:hypothetical protein